MNTLPPVNAISVPRAERHTVHIADNSDRGGLVMGQVIKARGYPGQWKVVHVYPVAPPREGLIAPRTYDIERIPGSRKDRRRMKAQLR